MRLLLLPVLIFSSFFSIAQKPEVVIQDGYPSIERNNFVHFVVSAGNNYIVTYNETGNFKLWDFFTKRQIRSFQVKTEGIKLQCEIWPYIFSKPALSADNNYLLTEANNNLTAFSIWNTNTGKIENVIKANALGEKVDYNLAQFVINKNLIITHGVNRVKNKYEIAVTDLQNKTIKIFNYERPLLVQKKIMPTVHNKDWLSCILAASNDLEHIAMGTTDGRVYIFNTGKMNGTNPQTVTADEQFYVDTTNIRHLCFSDDGKLITIETRKATWIWNVQNRRLVKQYDYETGTMELMNQLVTNFYGTISQNCQCMAKRTQSSADPKKFNDQIFNVASGKLLFEQPITPASLPIFFNDDEWYSEDGRYQFRLSSETIDRTDLNDTDRSAATILSNRIEMDKTQHITHAVLDAATGELFISKVYNDALIFNLATGKSDYLRKFIYTPDTAYSGQSGAKTSVEFGDERNLYFSKDKKRVFTFDAQIPSWHSPRAIIWDRDKKTPLQWIDNITDRYGQVDPQRTLSENKEYITWINDFFSPYKLFGRPAPYKEPEEKDENGIGKTITPIEIVDNAQKIVRIIYPYGDKKPSYDYSKQAVAFMQGWAISPDDKTLYTGMNDGSVACFDIATGKQSMVLNERLPEEKIKQADGKVVYNPAQSIAIDGKGKFLFVARNDSNYNNFIAQYDLTSGKIIQHFDNQHYGTGTIVVHPDNRTMISVQKDNKIIFWNIASGKEIATMILSGKDYVLSIPEGYYMASRKGATVMHYVEQKKVYLFEQFDLKYNRPDIVLKKLGYASQQTIDNFQRAWEKRVTRAGFNPASFEKDISLNAPAIHIINPPAQRKLTQRNLQLHIQTEDKNFNIGKIQVRINGVPASGQAGIDVSALHSRSIDKNIDLVLSAGKNIVEVSSFNEKGIESLRETLELELTGVSDKPVLYLVGIGASKYADAQKNLDYAAKDAGDLVTELAKNSSGFKDVKQIKLFDNQVTKAAIQQLEETLSHSGIDDRVIIFYAGHGLFSKNTDYYLGTYDIDFANPEKNGLPFTDIENMLEKIPARDKIVFIDACHSGEIDKAETNLVKAQKSEFGDQKMRGVGNFVPGQEHVGYANSFELMKQTFADVTFRSGASIISAARGGEYAMESATLKNGIFTFCLLKGLTEKAADQNGDGKIYLSELQLYLEYMVGKLTSGKQQPTSRAENLVKDFRIW